MSEIYQIPESLADNFKIRASGISKIMGGSDGITEKQKQELNELLIKSQSKPLTANQQTKLSELSVKFNAKPEISAGAKTYCEEWLSGSIGMFNRRATKSDNKYTEKGLIVEDHAVDFIADMLGFKFLMKNEERKSNDYLTGCCDIEIPSRNLIIDNKSSWDFDTFPSFETKVPDSAYEWQGQGYMELYNRDYFWLVYTLMDTPENIILREAKSHCYKWGYGEVTKEILQEFTEKMTYKNIPNELKIKVFKIERDRNKAEQIKNRVSLCRDHIRTLIKQKNQEIINIHNAKNN